MIRKHSIALVMAASFALAGCGAQSIGTLATMPLATGTAAGAAPSVSLLHGTPAASIVSSHGAAIVSSGSASLQAPQSRQHVLVSTLQYTGDYTMTQDEMAADAQSQGYSVQSLSSSAITTSLFNDEGTVRRTSSGFALEVVHGIFHKTTTTYPLTGTPDILNKLTQQENEKVEVKGTIDVNSYVTVTSVDHEISLGFLTNWFTKGKITGSVKDANGVNLRSVEVDAKSQSGFVYQAFTGPDGRFQIKTLEPGSYAVSIDATGYEPVSASETVTARHAIKLVATLVAPAAAPAASASDTAPAASSTAPVASGTAGS